MGLWVGATALAGPLDALGARGGLGPGPGGARRHDPRLALPGRRQRRPQHARPARPTPQYRELRAPHRRSRPRPTLPVAGPPRVRLEPGPRRPEGALRPGQGRRAAVGGLRRRRPVALQLGRLLAPRHRGADLRPDRLARPHARRRRGRRQPAPGDQRLVVARPGAHLAPRGDGHGLRPEQLQLLHRGRLERRRFVARLPRRRRPARTGSAALAAARRTYANAFKVRDQLAPLRVDDDHPLPPVPVRLPGHRPRQGPAATWPGCSAPASAPASPRSRIGGFDTHDEQADGARRAAHRTSATRSSPGRPTSRRAASPAGCSP